MQMPKDILGTANGISGRESPHRNAPAQLERRKQARGLGGPHARNAFELGRERPCQRVEADILEQLPSQRFRRTTARTCAQ
jgi:hypothetical protein